MTTKMPWTEGPFEVYCSIIGKWYARNTNTGESVCFHSEPDARLFAASPAMYEELHQNLIVLAAQYEAAEKVGASAELLDILRGRVSGTVTALRAANPAAFDGEGE